MYAALYVSILLSLSPLRNHRI